MKKKIPFSLGELKVNSFITSIPDNESGEIKGGTEISCPQNCRTNEFAGCRITPHQVCGVVSVIVICQSQGCPTG